METFDSYEAIVQFGILKERQANRFYLAMAQRVADAGIRGLFEELAVEELEHRANLELELMKMGIVVDTTADTEEIDSSDYVISDSPQLDMDLRDVLELAVAKEDAAFRLYIDMAGKAENQESKDVLAAMAQEEARHKMRFEAERDKLNREERQAGPEPGHCAEGL
ncbi:MAG TPA: ferritin family protein [Sedimentisphaerales bacterium]|nr:ferritin family protein [Sedimentisphaerales bacterium]